MKNLVTIVEGVVKVNREVRSTEQYSTVQLGYFSF